MHYNLRNFNTVTGFDNNCNHKRSDDVSNTGINVQQCINFSVDYICRTRGIRIPCQLLTAGLYLDFHIQIYNANKSLREF